MIDCMIANELADRHIEALNGYSSEDTWEVAMARKAAVDLAWGIVCEHRALCPICKGGVLAPATVH